MFATAQVLLWWPVVSHYRVVVEPVKNDVIDAGRRAPSDAVLAAVAEASMMTDHPLSGDAAVTAANEILRGRLALPSLPVLPIDVNFSPRDLESGVPVQQLWIASLIVPDLLLRAYEHTHDPIYLTTAKRYVVEFSTYENRQWLPSGWLWNAHAISNRVAILSRLWKATRAAEDADTHTAQVIHSHATRLGAQLSKPVLFTAATNHGVMQNVALIQLGTAFPALPHSQKYRETALVRLRKQLPFYIDSEGVVLEHSAGYHFHGVVVTGFMVRLLQLAGEHVPDELTKAHQASLRFLRDLQRPDRSLPLIGNTFRYAWKLPGLLNLDDTRWGDELKSRASFARLYPIAGYAIWSEAGSTTEPGTQTVVPWGYFAGHGHMRAQEQSVLIWAEGTDWSTNTGYWPGDDVPGIEASGGWDGGNGPHVIGESAAQLRHTELLGYTQTSDLRMLDLERKALQGPTVRRQVVQVGATSWIVFDTYADASKRPLRTLWTAAPETQIRVLGEGRYNFRRPGRAVGLNLTLQGSSDVSSKTLHGSRAPFGGWVAHDRRADPAPSVDARLAAPTGWMAAVLQLAPGKDLTGASATVERFDGPEQWELTVQDRNGRRSVQRRGQELVINGGPHRGVSTTRLVLLGSPSVASEHHAIAQADAAIRAEFPRFRLYEPERQKVYLALVITWAGMFSLGWLICRRWRLLDRTLWSATHVAWLAGAYWLLFIYLGP